MILFDTHAHYDDPRFDGDRRAVLKSVFSDTPVRYITNVGTNFDTSRTSLELAEQYDGMFAAVGVHPSDCLGAGDPNEGMTRLAAMLEHPKAVAIGEIGLDYHYDDTPRDVQAVWFEAQMRLAAQTGYPVIIHDREAHGDCMDMIRRFPEVHGILHSFSGSREMTAELVRRGWYISFSGVITFKNASRVLEALRAVPQDRLLIETDCPYLAPVPMRGKTNHSGYLLYTAEAAATVLGMETEELCRITTENALRVYRIGDMQNMQTN